MGGTGPTEVGARGRPGRRFASVVATALIASSIVGPQSGHVSAAPPPPQCMTPARGNSPAFRGNDDGRTFLSADGRYVTIEMAGAATGPVIERHDLVTGATTSVQFFLGGTRDASADGRFVLYLENATFAVPAKFFVADLVLGTKTPVTLASGWTLRADYQGDSSQVGRISDDGQRVVLEARATGQTIPETLIVQVSNGAVTQVTDAVTSGGNQRLLAASGDATIVAVEAPAFAIEVIDTVAHTSALMPDSETSQSMYAEIVGNGRYLFVSVDGDDQLYDRLTAQTTSIGGPLQRVVSVSESGRYVLLGDSSHGNGTAGRGVVLDRQTGDSVLVGELTGLQQVPVDIADDGDTVVIRQYPVSLGVWQRPYTWVTRAGLPDLQFGQEPIQLPIGAVRSVPLPGLFPAGTTVSFGDGVVAEVDESAGRSVLTVAADPSVSPATRPMTVITPEGCRLDAGIYYFQFVDPGLTPLHSVVHPGETAVLDYAWFNVLGFTPTFLDVGQSAGGAVVQTGGPYSGTFSATVTMPASEPSGNLDLFLLGSGPDDFVVFPGAAALRRLVGEFHPVAPARIIDTRDGTGGRSGALVGGEPVLFKVAGVGGVPATGVGAVVVNVTVDAPTAPSFLTMWPADAPRPAASNLNFVRGQVVPNLVTAKVSPGGFVAIYNNTGAVHVIVDVVGWYSSSEQTVPGSAFVPVEPQRLLDTREDGEPIGQHETVDLVVAEPGSGITAVVLNVTVTEGTEPSYLSVVPSGTTPTTSSLNFVAGQTVPNLVVVPVGPDGGVSFYNNTGNVHVVADVFGFFDDRTLPVADGQLTAISPHRALDTRSGIGAPLGPVVPGAPVVLDLSGLLPAEATSVVMNVTVTEPVGPGFVTVWPSDLAQPDTSNLNYIGGLTVPNLVIIPVASDGTVTLATSGHAAHLVADVTGWYGPS